MAEILAFVLQHDEQAVLSAVELALETGVATKTNVLNVLHRLIDGKAPLAGRRRCIWFRSHSPMLALRCPSRWRAASCVMILSAPSRWFCSRR